MSNINVAIGADLKRLREAHKMTLQEVADKVGKSRKTIHAYEKGNIEISVSTLKSILNVYGVEMGKFLDDID